jgi:hypothetical protein
MPCRLGRRSTRANWQTVRRVSSLQTQRPSRRRARNVLGAEVLKTSNHLSVTYARSHRYVTTMSGALECDRRRTQFIRLEHVLRDARLDCAGGEETACPRHTPGVEAEWSTHVPIVAQKACARFLRASCAADADERSRPGANQRHCQPACQACGAQGGSARSSGTLRPTRSLRSRTSGVDRGSRPSRSAKAAVRCDRPTDVER